MHTSFDSIHINYDYLLQVYICERLYARREYYFAIALERAFKVEWLYSCTYSLTQLDWCC